MKDCKHANIVQYLGSYLRKDRLWICMEFCGGGSMQDIYHGGCLSPPPPTCQIAWLYIPALSHSDFLLNWFSWGADDKMEEWVVKLNVIRQMWSRCPQHSWLVVLTAILPQDKFATSSIVVLPKSVLCVIRGPKLFFSIGLAILQL